MKYSFSELRKIGKDNPASSWEKMDKMNDWNVPVRMKEEHLPVHLPALPYGIPGNSIFFAIGSCFARGIENALRGQGMTVSSYDPTIQSWAKASDSVTQQGAMNKYNPRSILKEMEWSENFESFPKELIVNVTESECIDLSLNQTLKLVDFEETYMRHKYISEKIFSRIWTADVVFITLGLIEVWTDDLTGLPLNGTPNPILFKKFPERFSVDTMSIAEIYEDLRVIIEKLKAASMEKKVFLTVSPVPLMRTFTENDVIVANTASKSRLRAVVSEIVEEYEQVAYFPSYEMVMNSNRKSAWESDMRHVKGEMTQYIMRTFIKNYIV